MLKFYLAQGLNKFNDILNKCDNNFYHVVTINSYKDDDYNIIERNYISIIKC